MSVDYAAPFTPFRRLPAGSLRMIALTELLIFLVVWYSTPHIIPKPGAILAAAGSLYQEGLIDQILISTLLFFESLLTATIVSLGLAYLSVIPAGRPIVVFVSSLRFLSLVGLPFLFTMMFGAGHALKLSMMVFAISVFYVTSMASIVLQVSREELDLARTLRMSNWRILWEVIVLGKADTALDLLIQNGAMGWMLLTTVEALSRTEGGIGVVLYNKDRYFNLAAVFAIQILIGLGGLTQDYFWLWVKRQVCPYAALEIEKR